jgi:hypothetical protein
MLGTTSISRMKEPARDGCRSFDTCPTIGSRQQVRTLLCAYHSRGRAGPDPPDAVQNQHLLLHLSLSREGAGNLSRSILQGKGAPSPLALSDRDGTACRDARHWRVLECADLN